MRYMRSRGSRGNEKTVHNILLNCAGMHGWWGVVNSNQIDVVRWSCCALYEESRLKEVRLEDEVHKMNTMALDS